MKKLIQFSLLFLIIIPGFLLGQSTFKVSGKVTDAKTGEALIGAAVILKPLNLGGATDLDGNYSFQQILQRDNQLN